MTLSNLHLQQLSFRVAVSELQTVLPWMWHFGRVVRAVCCLKEKTADTTKQTRLPVGLSPASVQSPTKLQYTVHCSVVDRLEWNSGQAWCEVSSFRCTLCCVYLCFVFSSMILPSGAGVISVIRRCGLGTGAGHTSFPRAGTSGKVNTISYRCCVFRKPTYSDREIFRELKGKETSKENNGGLSLSKVWTNPTVT